MSPIRQNTFTLSRIVKIILVISILVIGALYVAFQARLLIIGPRVTLTDVPTVVQTERQVTISGVAKNITDISLNGRPISTDVVGQFTERVVLENGVTIVRIDAEDRYGRHTSVERSFVYKNHQRAALN